MKKIKVIEYGIDDAGLLGVYAISVVEQPAIGVDFVALSEQHSVKFKEPDIATQYWKEITSLLDVTYQSSDAHKNWPDKHVTYSEL